MCETLVYMRINSAGLIAKVTAEIRCNDLPGRNIGAVVIQAAAEVVSQSD